jgi:purine-binding chemotaxis protein CheW
MAVELAEQFVVFKLGDGLYGLDLVYVKEMSQLGRINRIPETPDYVLGTMLLRDRLAPMFDLRLRLGLPSLKAETDELIDVLHQREADHDRWLEALEAAAKNGAEFTLPRDPHQCKFGKWYDRFHTDDLVLSGLLKKFDQPHKAVHAVADRVLGLAAEGERDQAQEVIDQTRDRELSALKRLFAQTRRILAERSAQVAVFLERNGRLYGLVVDEVLSVSRIPKSEVQSLSQDRRLEAAREFLQGVAKDAKNDGRLVFLLNGEALLSGEANAAAAP